MAFGFRRRAFLDITSLAFSLMGFIGLYAVVQGLKAGSFEIPRLLYLGFLVMAGAPFLVALVQPPKLPFLLPPVVAGFLAYPIGAPYGIVYSIDPIFNFAFTQNVLETGFWSPGAGTAFDTTYSFYPIGNVFVAYTILTTAAPPAVAFMWIQPIFRLLAVPATVYAIGQRLFGVRVAALALFFYLSTASVLFNSPIQQGVGTVFVGLSLLALVVLTQSPGQAQKRRAQILFMLVSAGIVMSHHLSSYIFAAWLSALGVLMLHPRFRPMGSGARLTASVIYFVALLNLYIVAFTWPIFFGHEQTFETVVTGLFAPQEFRTDRPSLGSGLGRTFSLLEIGLLGGSILGLLLFALIGVVQYRRARQEPFAVANGLVTAVMVLTTLPLLLTGLSYVPLRIGEYANFFIAPFAAATLLRWGRTDPFRLVHISRGTFRSERWLPKAFVVLICAVLFAGGSLAPGGNMRIYFETPSGRTSESPIYHSSDVIRSWNWAVGHFFGSETRTPRVWGDQLATEAFGGFAGMEIDFGSTRLFQGDTMHPTARNRLVVGDYIAVSRHVLVSRPNFFNEPPLPNPLTPEEIGKFDTDPALALVYRDEVFAIYRVMLEPCANPPLSCVA